jgi:hypothetical protein
MDEWPKPWVEESWAGGRDGVAVGGPGLHGYTWVEKWPGEIGSSLDPESSASFSFPGDLPTETNGKPVSFSRNAGATQMPSRFAQQLSLREEADRLAEAEELDLE